MEDDQMNGKRTLRFAASLMAVLVALSATKAAHAADSSTPVKVTNSANNPVVTEDVGQRASQMVYLSCANANTSVLDCLQYVVGGPQGQEFIEYTVPSDRYLVITAVDVNTLSPTGGACAGLTNIGLATRIGDDLLQRFGWTLAANAPTTHFTYPPGFAIAPGTTIQLRTSNCAAEVDMYGYLTAN
jgi:hypothetical protein